MPNASLIRGGGGAAARRQSTPFYFVTAGQKHQRNVFLLLTNIIEPVHEISNNVAF